MLYNCKDKNPATVEPEEKFN